MGSNLERPGVPGLRNGSGGDGGAPGGKQRGPRGGTKIVGSGTPVGGILLGTLGVSLGGGGRREGDDPIPETTQRFACHIPPVHAGGRAGIDKKGGGGGERGLVGPLRMERVGEGGLHAPRWGFQSSYRTLGRGRGRGCLRDMC